MRIAGPYCSSFATSCARSRGSRPTATAKPSSGASGSRLNTARKMLKMMIAVRNRLT